MHGAQRMLIDEYEPSHCGVVINCSDNLLRETSGKGVVKVGENYQII